MTTSSAIGDSGRVSTAGSGNKISFSHTVNRLSQYIKEKRARGATMNLFPVTEKPAPVTEDFTGGNAGHTINLFPQLSGFSLSSSKEPAPAPAPLMANSCVSKAGSPEPSAAQMTIFYGGKVIVFNDLPSDKAKEVMDLASNLELSVKKRKLETSNSVPASPVPVQNVNSNQNLNVVPNFGKNVIPITVVPTVADLPLTRKASLHRFLEKRRDRLVGKAPSSSDVPSGGSSKPVAEGNSWLGLGPLPVFQSQ